MKFTCDVEIDLPRTRVVQLWEDPENLTKWQDGFISITHLEGEKGAVGAKSSMLYKIRNKNMELIETILENNLPDRFSGKYVAKPMTNTMTNTFTELGDNKCRWTAEIHYTEMNGVMVKLMAFLFPKMFQKQTQKWLDQFKFFAENNK